MCVSEPDHRNSPNSQESCAAFDARNQMQAQSQQNDGRTSEQIMVDMVREDLGVTLSPQAWRMFLRHRWGRFSTLAHRIHEGKR